MVLSSCCAYGSLVARPSPRPTPAFPPPAIFANLPLDTLDTILAFLPRAALPAVCLVSRVFRVHGQDALYRDLHLDTPRALHACFSILASPARLAPRVRAFTLNSREAGSVYGALEDALPLLRNLRALSLFAGGDACAWVLPHADPAPFALHTFRTDVPFGADVGAFVARQPALRCMRVPWAGGAGGAGGLDAEALGLRHLTRVSAPWSLVAALVPGRPVCEVATFRDRRGTAPEQVRCLAGSTAPKGVERLQINYRFVREIGAALLAETLPALACLAVTFGEEKETDLPGWIATFLAKAPPLHCFHLRLQPYIALNYHDPAYLAAVDKEQDLQYLVISKIGSQGYAATRVDGAWTRCSAHATKGVLAHATFA
ncbi:hypothetical protein B0H15DRAFT_949052 [Mycena belliarum]|uniref:F-box domain-containing protein n=1 Tax=Mycena belliarum TaxID=1033014 RepID=A0AAD6U406_9AGAR|nr:hypothetical protein B0H15DRAFT_949052 [Mycena belliae]